jgi:hypothetical protein
MMSSARYRGPRCDFLISAQCRRAALGPAEIQTGLAEGISRSTWHRRRKVAREREALAARAATFALAETFAAALKRDLERCAAIHAVMARELALPTVKLI